VGLARVGWERGLFWRREVSENGTGVVWYAGDFRLAAGDGGLIYKVQGWERLRGFERRHGYQYHGTAWMRGNARKLLNLWRILLELGLNAESGLGGGGGEE